MEREKLLENIKAQIKKGKRIIGVATGTGMTAKYAERGGADFLLVLNSGRFRQMGRSSLAGFLPFCNSNDMVIDFASKEIISLVEAIRIAHKKNMFTVAFVFNEIQAEQMIDAGADVICVHLGLTGGGLLGAKKVFSLEAAKVKTEKIFNKCNELNPNVIKLIYGGPVKTPIDVQYMYSNNEDLMGYIGGSAFERIPSEKSITNITKAFKVSTQLDEESLMLKMLDGVTKHYNYVEFVKEYVAENYMNDVSLNYIINK